MPANEASLSALRCIVVTSTLVKLDSRQCDRRATGTPCVGGPNLEKPMPIPASASLDEVTEYVSGTGFDAVREINASVRSSASLEEQYSASVELVAQLDSYSQDVASALQAALDSVQRSEKRLPHQIELLKSDLRSFNASQARAAQSLPSIIEPSARSPALAELAELHEVRRRIEQVQTLLRASRSGTHTPEQAQQFATMFEGTPEEARWKQGGADYYNNIINKIIN